MDRTICCCARVRSRHVARPTTKPCPDLQHAPETLSPVAAAKSFHLHHCSAVLPAESESLQAQLRSMLRELCGRQHRRESASREVQQERSLASVLRCNTKLLVLNRHSARADASDKAVQSRDTRIDKNSA